MLLLTRILFSLRITVQDAASRTVRVVETSCDDRAPVLTFVKPDRGNRDLQWVRFLHAVFGMDRRALARPQRVLVVEDSADIRGLWRMWLTFSGFLVDEASNGSEAITLARSTPPDLVLMDLCMPVMDGVEAIRLLRADAATSEVPIVVITAQGTDESAQRAAEAGADAYVDKPVMPDELLQHMRDAFNRKLARPAAGMVRSAQRAVRTGITY
jgi:CheY-like chemotaxis protein